jgi:hypothetical protein
MLDTSVFTSGDPEVLYARMRPDQRTAIANEFIRCLYLANDPNLEQLRPQSPPSDGAVARPPMMLTPQQVAALHTYTRTHHPDLFTEVCEHPVTQASLAAPGTALTVEDEGEDAAKTKRDADLDTASTHAHDITILHP